MANVKKDRKSKINFNVSLDEQQIPEKIMWNATDAEFKEEKECSSIMISVWDTNKKTTLSIDLWTKSMIVEDMHLHFFQTLISMSESFQRATGNKLAVPEMKKFCNELADKIVPEKKKDQAK